MVLPVTSGTRVCGTGLRRGADRHHRLATESFDDGADAGRVGAPVEVRFGSDEHDEVAPAEAAHDVEAVLGPADDAHLALVDLDLRALLREVVERIGIDLADVTAMSAGAKRSSADVAAPAMSNSPVRAITITGERSGAELLGVERQHLVDVHAVRVRAVSASTTASMQAVSASTSAGSIAGNMPIRSWLRPSLR